MDWSHRHLNVSSQGSVLHFTVTCPSEVLTRYAVYDRGFSVQGSELWLFQPSLIEIYRMRQ